VSFAAAKRLTEVIQRLTLRPGRAGLWPLGGRAQALLALLAAAVVISGLLNYESLRTLRERSAAVDHTFEVLAAGQSVFVSLQDADAGARDYVLSGNRALLDNYRAGASHYRERFEQLRALTRDHPLQQSRLAALEPVIAAKMAELASIIDSYDRGAVAEARARVASAGSGAIEDIRGRIRDIQATERSLLETRTDKAAAAYRFAIALAVTIALLLVLLLALFLASGRRDLMNLRRLEASVAEKETQLRIALDSAAMGTHVWDIATNKVEWDARLRQLWSVGPTEPINYALFKEGVHPDDRETTQAAVDAALNPDGGGRYSTEYRVIGRDDGQTRWVHATGHVFFDGRRPLQMIGTAQDITRGKYAEAALREADRRKDEFLATLAHELRNPLAPIRNAAGALRVAGTERREWAIGVIERQIQTMARLLEDLLDVSRITRGALPLQKQRVRLAALIEGALETARPLIDARRHTVRVMQPDSVELDADPVRLEQVLSNLLTNAAKYMDQGGHIDLTVAVSAGDVSITVRDAGIGLEPESLQGVFNIFSQVKSALHRSEGGLGIGLALVRGIVELHGGSIEARSAGLGRGSDFVVRLPLPIPAATQSLAASAPPELPARRRRVLVADDNRDGAETLGLLLELAGHEVRIAHGGQAALAATRQLPPEIAIIDIGMPDLNGYELARAIRATDWGKSAVLVAITGWGQDGDKERAFEAGFDAHLTKPVDPRVLESVLRSDAVHDLPRSACY
jgi:PAS domain S-box-containing protein